MRLSPKILRALSCSLIAFLLVAQAAFATPPCVEPAMSAMQSGSDDGCCQTSVEQMSLCAAQCTGNDRLSAHPPVVIPAASTQLIAIVDFPAEHLPNPRFWVVAASRDPPKSIRFCSLLI